MQSRLFWGSQEPSLLNFVRKLLSSSPHQILIDLFIWMLIIVFPVYWRYQRHQTLAAMITRIIIPGLSWSCGGSPADTNTRHHKTFICEETEGDINLNVLFSKQKIFPLVLMRIFLPRFITMVFILDKLKLNEISFSDISSVPRQPSPSPLLLLLLLLVGGLHGASL